MSGTSLAVAVTFGKDSGGHPTLAAAGCSLGIGHLSITFHGGARSCSYNTYLRTIITMHVYVCVCMHACMSVCMHACMSMCACMHVYIRGCCHETCDV